MSDEKNNLIIAYFASEAAAKEAAEAIKEWDKDLGAIDLGAIGILSMDKKGKLKTHKVGEHATGSGAKWGTAIGAAAGILTGGIGLIGGAVVGLTIGSIAGAFFHKKLGMDDAEKARLEEHLKGGGAALAVMTNAHDVSAVRDKLGFLGGESATYAVPTEVVAELEAADDTENTAETKED